MGWDMKTILPLLVFATLSASVLANDAAPTSTDGSTIKQARLRQNAAIVRGDLVEIAAYWTDDVTICRGLGAQLAGKSAYLELFAADAKSAEKIVYQRHPTAIDVSSVWPLAFETGRWQGHLGSEQGPTVIGGQYSAQWVKRGDRWLIRSEVFVALEGSGSGLQMKAVP
jgi:ketosteroid isomerase-like protein